MDENLIVTIYVIVLLFCIVSLIGAVYIYRLLDRMIRIENKYLYTVNQVELNFIKTFTIVLFISLTVGLTKNSANVLKTGNIKARTGVDMLVQFLSIIALLIILTVLYSANNIQGDEYSFEADESKYNYMKFGAILVIINLSIEILLILYNGLELFYFEGTNTFSSD